MNSSNPSTRDRILDTVYNLVSKHPLDQITINDILQDAHVSRPTFYRYFSDKYDAANEVYYRHGYESYSLYKQQKDLVQYLTSLYCVFYEHRAFYNHMLSDIQAQNCFFTFWQQTNRMGLCFDINPKKSLPRSPLPSPCGSIHICM